MALKKVLLAALFLGLAGIPLFSLMFEAEEEFGLGLLFTFRGLKSPPADVCIIALDKASEIEMGLPDKPRLWPRGLYAQLTRNLKAMGAEVIVFDILFDEPRPVEDQLFAAAMKEAGNVVLCQSINRELLTVKDAQGAGVGYINLESVSSPTETLAGSALALAPFPLPKVPVRLNQFWTVKKTAGDIPTLPVVAFQIFTLDVYPVLLELLKRFSPVEALDLPQGIDAIRDDGDIHALMENVRRIFADRPTLSENMLAALENGEVEAPGPEGKKRLRSLIRMYARGPRCYLNHFGPAGTFEAFSFYKLVKQGGEFQGVAGHAVQGKAVFVGQSESLRPQRSDGFHTVFSLSSGIEVSGVEIAATAFANLLQDECVEPLSAWWRLAVIIGMGAGMAVICLLLPAVPAAATLVLGGAGYFLFALYRFDQSAVWYPLIVPLGLQLPLAFFGSVLWKYGGIQKERKRIREAFGYYLPDGVVDGLLKDLSSVEMRGHLVYGVCLFTDAERYTSLSESMDPESLGRLMNRYFGALFEPVKRNGGFVAEVVGDGMLAIWTTARPDTGIRGMACRAALEIGEAVSSFGRASEGLVMPTRIGLHSGYIYLGNLGAMGRYEYRPVGDIVNTASRIEGLNKYLRTQSLVSESVIQDVQGILAREMGSFVMVGKSRATRIFELLCRLEDADESRLRLCRSFAEGLKAFREQAWERALDMFTACLEMRGEDGPSRFYLNLIHSYRESPPERMWDGSVHLDRK